MAMKLSKKSAVQTIASLGTTLALAGCSIIPVERRVTEKEVMFAKQSTVSKLEEQIREPTFAEPPVQATSKYLPEAEKYAGIAQTSFTLYSNEKGAELVKTSVDTRGILNPYVPLFSQIESTLIASSTKRLTLTDNSIAQTISPRNVSYNFASSGLSRVEFSTTGMHNNFGLRISKKPKADVKGRRLAQYDVVLSFGEKDFSLTQHRSLDYLAVVEIGAGIATSFGAAGPAGAAGQAVAEGGTRTFNYFKNKTQNLTLTDVMSAGGIDERTDAVYRLFSNAQASRAVHVALINDVFQGMRGTAAIYLGEGAHDIRYDSQGKKLSYSLVANEGSVLESVLYNAFWGGTRLISPGRVTTERMTEKVIFIDTRVPNIPATGSGGGRIGGEGGK